MYSTESRRPQFAHLQLSFFIKNLILALKSAELEPQALYQASYALKNYCAQFKFTDADQAALDGLISPVLRQKVAIQTHKTILNFAHSYIKLTMAIYDFVAEGDMESQLRYINHLFDELSAYYHLYSNTQLLIAILKSEFEAMHNSNIVAGAGPIFNQVYQRGNISEARLLANRYQYDGLITKRPEPGGLAVLADNLFNKALTETTTQLRKEKLAVAGNLGSLPAMYELALISSTTPSRLMRLKFIAERAKPGLQYRDNQLTSLAAKPELKLAKFIPQTLTRGSAHYLYGMG